jgi:hypothetical protein
MGSSQHDGDRRLQRWQGLVSEGWWTEQEDSGFHSQLVPLSSGYALAHKMLRSVNSAFCLFLGMGVTHSILPICLWFYMLAVISCNSHLQEDRWEDKPGGADNSSVHHTDKHISRVLHYSFTDSSYSGKKRKGEETLHFESCKGNILLTQ